jgi:multidrug efflux pump subunit AcrA (membrane-fusion protein)
MQVVASFAETDAIKIVPGAAATVTVDALPNVSLPAHVLSIAGTATSSSGVVTYSAVFALDHSEPKIKPGMTANVDVVVSEADNVLQVPTAAVTGSGKSATVTVLKNGKQTVVPVVAGLAGDSTTEIISGLTNGETVVLPSVTIATTTTSTGTGTTGGFTRGGGGFGGFGGGLGG